MENCQGFTGIGGEYDGDDDDEFLQ
uniref:Uncharacterized protein n=1 Tax=Romanomermis culicivorax TaxID=13658 RepID=A0A915JPR9_ROMCU